MSSWHVGDLSWNTGAPAAAGDPVGYVRSDGVNSVVYRDFYNHVHELYLKGGSWHVGDLSAKTGAPPAL
jgi:hypothetical protein